MSELKNAVDELRGLKPIEIAATIKRRKIKGRPGTTGRCPLALMMQGVLHLARDSERFKWS